MQPSISNTFRLVSSQLRAMERETREGGAMVKREKRKKGEKREKREGGGARQTLHFRHRMDPTSSALL